MPKKTRREKALAKAAAKLQSFDDWREDKRGKKPKKKKKTDATRRKMEKMHKQDQPLPHQLDKDKGSKKKPKGPLPSAVKARAKAATRALTKKAKETIEGLIKKPKPNYGYGSKGSTREAKKFTGKDDYWAMQTEIRKGLPHHMVDSFGSRLAWARHMAQMVPTMRTSQRVAEEGIKKKEKAKADARRKAKAKKGKDTTPSKGRAPVE